jgi:hypothetical protein
MKTTREAEAAVRAWNDAHGISNVVDENDKEEA